MWIQNAGEVRHLAFSPDGHTLYTLASSGALTAWDVAARTGRRVAVLLPWAANGHGLFPLADGRRIVNLDNWATVLDVDTGADLGGVRRLTDHKTGLRRVTPEGRVFYIKPSGVAVGVWNLATRGPEPARDTPKAARRIRNFDVSADEQSVALVGFKGAVAVYDWGAGPELGPARAAGGPADDVRFAPDGRTLALFSERRVQMWDLSRGEPLGDPIPVDTRRGAATFAFHPTAPAFIAIDRDKHPTLFGTRTGDPVRSLDFSLGRVECLAFAPDGLTCAVGGSNKQFAVFDVDL